VQEECQAQLARRVRLQGFSDGDEVLEGFGHFASIDVQMAGMQEVVHPVAVPKRSLNAFSITVSIVLVGGF
jgi:hypothetical protein